MRTSRTGILFLNLGHFLDHLLMLVFATAVALRLTTEWGLSYAELIPYATPGFVAFGLCAIPAGWLADKWSREGMMIIFFIGIGVSALFAGMSNNPLQISLSLTLLGVFAAIYHPVGLAMVVQGRRKTGVPLAINGIFGNMGVACAALATGFLIDAMDWRAAFLVPGSAAVIIGVLYAAYILRTDRNQEAASGSAASHPGDERDLVSRAVMIRVFAVIFFTTAVGGLIFQSTTFALPKVFDERLGEIASSATQVGWYAFVVFAIAAFAQLAVGYLVDRYAIKWVFAAIASLQALFFFIMMQTTGLAALVVSVAFMLAVFGQIPINDVLVGRVTRSEWRSRAYAFRYIVTFSVMASAVPLIAWIHGYWGFDALFAVLAIAALLILGAIWLLPRANALLAGPAR